MKPQALIDAIKTMGSQQVHWNIGVQNICRTAYSHIDDVRVWIRQRKRMNMPPLLKNIGAKLQEPTKVSTKLMLPAHLLLMKVES